MIRAPKWERRYARKLVTTDTLIVLVAVFGAQMIRFGTSWVNFGRPVSSSALEISYTWVSIALSLSWLLALHLGDTRKPQIFGTGATEYRRVTTATFAVFGVFTLVAYLLALDIGRGYLLIALPMGLLLLLCSRYIWRKRLHSRRKMGKNSYRTLLIGDYAKVRHIHQQMAKRSHEGFSVVAVATKDVEAARSHFTGLQVDSFDRINDLVRQSEVDNAIIANADDISPERLQHIGWALDEQNVDLLVAAALVDVAGPRIHMRPASGFPLIHVGYPKLTGGKQFVKRGFDILGSLILSLLLSPVLIIVAVVVKVTSRGSIFYTQTRIGARGKPFEMFKFRSMVQDADDQLASLLDAQGSADKPLHKINDDPRITPVGRILRRYSFDELPQLFNVLLGNMSLVGPRPQREREVALYEKHHHRRLLVKPGVTGLWQVSGRSALNWDDAIRLDLYYVENWSLIGDIVILSRTVRAVIAGDGAQ